MHLVCGSSNVNCSLVLGEWDDIGDYAKSYLNLTGEDYRVTWWKLFNGPDPTRWSNILSVVELLFCIPVSNGHLERMISQLIKTDRRSWLGEENMDNLLRIKLEAPPLKHWDATGALNLWWKDKTCRLNVTDPQPGVSSIPTQSDAREEEISLEDWETWLA